MHNGRWDGYWTLVDGEMEKTRVECKPKGGKAHNKSISIKLDPGREYQGQFHKYLFSRCVIVLDSLAHIH